MARIIRIYPGIREGTNYIGFSADAIAASDDRLVRVTLSAQDYKVREPEEEPRDSISYEHLEVEPPINDKHLDELRSMLPRQMGASALRDHRPSEIAVAG